MTSVRSSSFAKQPLQFEDPWQQFRHLVSAAMCETGWPGGPQWERYGPDRHMPRYPADLAPADFNAWCVDLHRASKLASTVTGIGCLFDEDDWPVAICNEEAG